MNFITVNDAMKCQVAQTKKKVFALSSLNEINCYEECVNQTGCERFTRFSSFDFPFIKVAKSHEF